MKKHQLLYLFLFFISPLLGQDGSLDSSFGDGGVVLEDYNGAAEYGNRVAQFEDGTIVTGGYILLSGNIQAFFLSRFFENGQIDTTFGDNGFLISDPGISQQWLEAIIPFPDGSFLAAVKFPGANYLRKYLTDGTLDGSFGNNGQVIIPISEVIDVLELSDNKLMCYGNFGNGLKFTRLNEDGTVDSLYGDSGSIIIPMVYSSSNVSSAVIGQDDRLLVAVATRENPLLQKLQLRKFSSSGQQDLSFGNNGVVEKSYDYVGITTKIQLYDDDNKIIVAVGKAIDRKFNIPYYLTEVMRFSENGEPDTTFGANGMQEIMGTGFWPLAIFIQANSRIIIGGRQSDLDDPRIKMVRLFNNGVRDYSFIEDAYTTMQVQDIIQQNDGKILASGDYYFGELNLARYNNNPLGVNDFGTNTMKLYPNPAIDNINIQNGQSVIGEAYMITDAAGRLIMDGVIIPSSSIGISNLQNGIYFLTIQNHTERFIKE